MWLIELLTIAALGWGCFAVALKGAWQSVLWSLSLLNGVNGVERSPATRMRVTRVPRALL